MLIDLSDDERVTLVAFLHRLIDEARYPHAPVLQPLRSALAKIETAPPQPEPPKPPPDAGGIAGRLRRR